MIMNKAALFVVAALLSTSVWSQEGKGGGDLRSAVQNPISSLISLPFKFTFDYGADNGEASILSINPVVPVTVGDWNLVNRALIPMANVDGAITGPQNPSPKPGNGASGLGDINYSIYFSPVKYDKVIWGVGPSNAITALRLDGSVPSAPWLVRELADRFGYYVAPNPAPLRERAFRVSHMGSQTVEDVIRLAEALRALLRENTQENQ